MTVPRARRLRRRCQKTLQGVRGRPACFFSLPCSSCREVEQHEKDLGFGNGGPYEIVVLEHSGVQPFGPMALVYCGLKETIRQDFSLQELQWPTRHSFAWQCLLATGHSGGILLGMKEDTVVVLSLTVSIGVCMRRQGPTYGEIVRKCLRVQAPSEKVKSPTSRCPEAVD